MNRISIAIQGSYKKLELALFRGHICVDSICEFERHSSSFLVPLIKTILDRNNIDLKNVNFFSVNNGPGAFTSLRVVMATVNGLAFSSGIKLVGVDGLDALAEESFNLSKKFDNKPIVAMLNAYNNDVYYAIYECFMGSLKLCGARGYKKAGLFLEELFKKYPGRDFLFTGNGVLLCENVKPEIEEASAKQIGIMGIKLFETGNFSSELQPAYIKEQTYAVR